MSKARSRKNGRHAADKKGREFPMAEDGQQYGRVTKMLGNGRVKAKLEDGSERTCRIRGNMRRREWVHVGDMVLVALREELAGDTGDIIFKYAPADVQYLKRLGIHISDEEETEEEAIVQFEDAEEDGAIDFDAM